MIIQVYTYSGPQLREVLMLDSLEQKAFRVDRWTREFRRAQRAQRFVAKRKERATCAP